MNLSISKLFSFPAEASKALKLPIFSIHDVGKQDPWLASACFN